MEPEVIDTDNEQIAKVLELISIYYKLEKDKNRETAYSNGAKAILNSEEEITSGAEAKSLQGVGVGIAKDIEEFLQTGKIERLEKLEYKYKVVKPVLDHFMSIYGIGPVTAINFYNQGFRTVDDLWYKAKLTEAQKNGILWRDHFAERIPREEMDIINDTIGEIFKPNNIKYVITGSYRREEPSSGDIDILVEARSDLDMDLILLLLDEYIPTILSKGPKKFAGVFQLSDNDYGRRLDILLVSMESWGTSLLHFTGSGRFNVLMRNKAKSLGMKLSEYRLTDKNGVALPVNTEEDIFDYLKVKYLAPKERTKTLKSLS
jgi:DNA polymerase/3'-5' exonuclease PolX